MSEFELLLKSGQIKRLESDAYLEYVRTLACVGCGAPARNDPHHMIGEGFGGTGTKAGDDMAFPLCRLCHNELHHNVDRWELENGPQWKHVALTLMQFLREARH